MPDPYADADRLDLDAIQARADAATPGPWQVSDPNEGSCNAPFWMVTNDAFHNPPDDDDTPWIAAELHTGDKPDAEFIAHARADVPVLVARVRQLEGERVNLEAGVKILLTTIDKLADGANALVGEIADLRSKLTATETELDEITTRALAARVCVDTTRRDGAADGILLARSHISYDDREILTILARHVRDGMPVPTAEATDV